MGTFIFILVMLWILYYLSEISSKLSALILKENKDESHQCSCEGLCGKSFSQPKDN